MVAAVFSSSSPVHIWQVARSVQLQSDHSQKSTMILLSSDGILYSLRHIFLLLNKQSILCKFSFKGLADLINKSGPGSYYFLLTFCELLLVQIRISFII